MFNSGCAIIESIYVIGWTDEVLNLFKILTCPYFSGDLI